MQKEIQLKVIIEEYMTNKKADKVKKTDMKKNIGGLIKLINDMVRR